MPPYFILQGGSLESVLFFEGYWRFADNTETGLAQSEFPVIRAEST